MYDATEYRENIRHGEMWLILPSMGLLGRIPIHSDSGQVIFLLPIQILIAMRE